MLTLSASHCTLWTWATVQSINASISAGGELLTRNVPERNPLEPTPGAKFERSLIQHLRHAARRRHTRGGKPTSSTSQSRRGPTTTSSTVTASPVRGGERCSASGWHATDPMPSTESSFVPGGELPERSGMVASFAGHVRSAATLPPRCTTTATPARSRSAGSASLTTKPPITLARALAWCRWRQRTGRWPVEVLYSTDGVLPRRTSPPAISRVGS